jgi:hypothetical protein
MTTTVTTNVVPPAAPAFGGDFADEVAELSVENGKENRSIDQQIEQTEQDLAWREADDEVGDLRKKADDVRTQGIVDGCATMGQGAFQAASAGCSFEASGATASSSASLNAQAGWYKSAATGLDGTTKLVDGFFGADEANAEASAKEADQTAQSANDAARAAHDAASNEQQTVDKTLDAYSQISQAQASASLAILHRA